MLFRSLIPKFQELRGWRKGPVWYKLVMVVADCCGCGVACVSSSIGAFCSSDKQLVFAAISVAAVGLLTLANCLVAVMKWHRLNYRPHKRAAVAAAAAAAEAVATAIKAAAVERAEQEAVAAALATEEEVMAALAAADGSVELHCLPCAGRGVCGWYSETEPVRLR